MADAARTDAKAQVDNYSNAKHYSYKHWDEAFKKFMTIGIGLPAALDKAAQGVSRLPAYMTSQGKRKQSIISLAHPYRCFKHAG